MPLSRSIRRTAAVAVAAILFVPAGCSDGTDTAPPAGDPSASHGALDLSGVCPETIVVQTNWWPEVTAAGALYHLLGRSPHVDTRQKRVTAPLVVHDQDTGVELELRAGGPAIGFTPVPAQMQLDRSITLGVAQAFDEVLRLSATQSTLAVLAQLEIDPQTIEWDPGTYPAFEAISDIGATDTTVLYVEGATYMDYLVGSGMLKRSQLDGSYGDPARFVAERGRIAQQGYATVSPQLYEEEVEEWGKPIRYQLVYDAGYPNYGSPLIIHPDDEPALAPCLRKLIPIIQQAQIDLLAEPDRAIDLSVRLNEEYETAQPFTRRTAEFSIAQMESLDLVGNGDDATIGNFDEARIQRLIDITSPIFAAQKKPVEDGLKPSDVLSNEFIDPEIGRDDD